jgi:hypothetical protein
MARKADMISVIEKLLTQAAREHFPNAVIEAVHVVADTDSDGEPIYRVNLVFESAKGLESRATSSFVRHVRPKLEEHKQFRFPLVSFMTSADHKKLAAA